MASISHSFGQLDRITDRRSLNPLSLPPITQVLNKMDKTRKKIIPESKKHFSSNLSLNENSESQPSRTSSEKNQFLIVNIPTKNNQEILEQEKEIKLSFNLFKEVLKNLPNKNSSDENTLEAINRIRSIISNKFQLENIYNPQEELSLISLLKMTQSRNFIYQNIKYFSLNHFLQNTYSLISQDSFPEIYKHNSMTLFRKIIEKLSDKVTNDQKFIFEILASLLNFIANNSLKSDLEKLTNLKNHILQNNLSITNSRNNSSVLTAEEKGAINILSNLNNSKSVRKSLGISKRDSPKKRNYQYYMRPNKLTIP